MEIQGYILSRKERQYILFTSLIVGKETLDNSGISQFSNTTANGFYSMRG
jgi:hypothetical protein